LWISSLNSIQVQCAKEVISGYPNSDVGAKKKASYYACHQGWLS